MPSAALYLLYHAAESRGVILLVGIKRHLRGRQQVFCPAIFFIYDLAEILMAFIAL